MSLKRNIGIYIFLSLFACLLFPSYAVASSLIFVHLGKVIPSCILTTMKQARYLNPDCDIYLLLDEDAYSIFQNTHPNFIDEEKIHLINMNLIPKSLEHVEFCTVNKLPSSLEKGYWMYATKRFFTLYDFIKVQGLTDVLHLESDSMLYVELEELIPIFTELNIRLAAPFQSLKGCIPCFVFIKDIESLSHLINHIILEMKNFKGVNPHICLNDMQTLASFYRKFGPNFLLPLPTLMPDYAKNYSKKRSSFPPDNATPLSFLSLYSELFPEYLFDAAGLGIFVNGNDRTYSPSHGPGTVHSRCLFNPIFFSFFWGKNNKEQNVPYLSFKGKRYRIVNMHFHSKMPQEYTSFITPLGQFPCGVGF